MAPKQCTCIRSELTHLFPPEMFPNHFFQIMFDSWQWSKVKYSLVPITKVSMERNFHLLPITCYSFLWNKPTGLKVTQLHKSIHNTHTYNPHTHHTHSTIHTHTLTIKGKFNLTTILLSLLIGRKGTNLTSQIKILFSPFSRTDQIRWMGGVEAIALCPKGGKKREREKEMWWGWRGWERII